MRRLDLIILFTLGTAVFAGAQLAQPPVEERSATAGLEREVLRITAARSPVWIAYSAPVIEGDRQMCCFVSQGSWKHERGACRLERQGGGYFQGNDDHGREMRPQADFFYVFLRFEQRQLDKVRVFSHDCRIEAGDAPVVWLNDVDPRQSIEYLLQAARTDGPEDRRPGRAGVDAIALHAHPAADAALEALAAPGEPTKMRSHAAFWMASARGRRGFEAVRRLIREERDPQVRSKLVFPLHVSEQPEAVEELVRLAKSDDAGKVRGEAIFWLAQRAGRQAAAAITDAIENDPETAVKKKAVFALTQMPRDEGIPLLIKLARSHHNAAVRKQAIFWLGQTKDPRAIAFLEEVLLK